MTTIEMVRKKKLLSFAEFVALPPEERLRLNAMIHLPKLGERGFGSVEIVGEKVHVSSSRGRALRYRLAEARRKAKSRGGVIKIKIGPLPR